MPIKILFILQIAVLICFASWGESVMSYEPEKPGQKDRVNEETRVEPTDIWAMRLAQGVDPMGLARKHGLEYIGPVGTLEGFHLFRVPPEKARVFDAPALRDSPEVLWLEQQHKRKRYKRQPADPLFEDQWHLNNIGQSGGTPGIDANILPVWDMGFLGTGVQIAIVDDGLEHIHPDIQPNYSAADSWDFNDNDFDPSPGPGDYHGTAVAGVAAARDDGFFCGVGSAFRSGLSGIRLIAEPVTDAQEAAALIFSYQNNHIFNNSWGPKDDGRRLEGPGYLADKALAFGTQKGRGGLGSIYVWAGGNGRRFNDNINYDGYANSRFTIAVGAVNHFGIQTFYSEPGAPMLVTAPSSGAGVGITTTDRLSPQGFNNDGDCFTRFGGTSSSAPLVSGIIALMLQANPQLTWRDVQHILVRSVLRNDPLDTDWSRNRAGRWINHKYGFGMVDAHRAVNQAISWPGTREASFFDSGQISVDLPIPDNNPAGVSSSFFVPPAQTEDQTLDLVLEHVEVVFTATHSFRGDLEIELISPGGTSSILALSRLDDNSDYPGWKFTTVRHWGELARGVWTLKVADVLPQDMGTFDSWQLILHGTEKVRRIVPVQPGVLKLLLDDE